MSFSVVRNRLVLVAILFSLLLSVVIFSHVDSGSAQVATTESVYSNAYGPGWSSFSAVGNPTASAAGPLTYPNLVPTNNFISFSRSTPRDVPASISFKIKAPSTSSVSFSFYNASGSLSSSCTCSVHCTF